MSFDIVGILTFILALVAMIIIHEFGHFVAARLFKVEVEEFGIGFPPRLFTLFKAWGTNFTLNAIPLGGFVRPKGENDPNVPGGLAAASPWVRLGVLVAGPLMNLLLGVVLYAVIVSRIGMADPARPNVVEINSVSPNSPAQVANLRPGDVLLEVNGQAISGTQQVHDLIYANIGKPVTILLERGGQKQTITLTPRQPKSQNEGAVGITMGPPTIPVPVYVAIPAGFEAVGNYVVLLGRLPVRMISGQTDPNNDKLVGLPGMYDIYQQARRNELAPGTPPGVSVLLVFAAITTSLGILNLVPFPALDGGRILFTLPEIILRRRIPQQYENAINLVGFMILIALMLYINFKEIFQMIQ